MMEFTKPTTKEQMYATLQTIYNYYRVTRENYAPVTFDPLTLSDMTVTELTDEQLGAKAEALLKFAHEREVLALKKTINEKLAALNAKKSSVTSDAAALEEKINAAYLKSEDKVEKEAVKKGFAHSNVVLDKLAEMESKKNAEVAKAEADKNAAVAEINAEISSLNAALAGADNYYDDIHAYEKAAKVTELKDAQEKQKTEAFKYNNSISEKKQRYANAIKQLNMTYRLKFMEIKNVEFTKEQLYDMGYYQDVIDCVCGYYDTLEATAAFTDISKEGKLVLYLEDYYQNVIYMYKSRKT